MHNDSNTPGCKDARAAASKLVQLTPKLALDIDAIRAKLAGASGPVYWRSLEELAETPEFEEVMHREFPRYASEWDPGVSRRDFIKLMGASLALAGLVGCTRQPLEPIVPYVVQPEEMVLGESLFFATAMPLGGIGRPLLVRSQEGRPNKVEGNPEHGASLGAADAFAQAAILQLYDPGRATTVQHNGQVDVWGALLANINAALKKQEGSGAAGIRFLTETITSPSLINQFLAMSKRFPNAKWYQYDAVNRDNAKAGARMAFGQPLDAIYHLDKADVILSLDGEFLSPTGLPGNLRYARDFSSRRKNPSAGMNRLYAVESAPSLTGAMSDHRLIMRASEILPFARALAAEMGMAGASPATEHEQAAWAKAVIKDLQQHRGACVVIPGENQPPELHAIAHFMNQNLGAMGKTVDYIDAVDSASAKAGTQIDGLRELVADMDAGRVQLLIILGGNPVFTAPADLHFAPSLLKVHLRVHLGMYDDETSGKCQWHVPESHFLESWGDTRAYDGAVSIIQPLIAPLHESRSAYEMMSIFTQQPEQSGYDVVRAYWQSQFKGKADEFEMFWRKSLHDGFVAGTTSTPRAVTAKAPALSAQMQPAVQGIEINFRPDPSIYDGCFADNAWLQELPKPLNKLTWSNAVLMNPEMMARLGLRNDDIVELDHRGWKLQAPVWDQPGHPDNAITINLGYGRTRAGRTGSTKGFNAYLVRLSDTEWFGGPVTLRKTGEKNNLAATRNHYPIDTKSGMAQSEARDVVRVARLEEFQRDPEFAHPKGKAPERDETMYPQYKYEGYAWGMAIDLNSCIGCNACVMACQAENNIPVVGREQILREREMHWLRVDTYHEGDMMNPRTVFQPVPCMHCEDAPCELVCPVGATVHGSEGLNEMIYNRCVGTRYCSNNCPYKVRRFNFMLWQDWTQPLYKLMRNPDVTVRSRGVMEKCTYCIQRINRVRYESEKQDRKIRDQEVQTACQQTCPTGAIIFGDLNDKNSRVSKLKADSRNYGLLEELNTRPRTTYIAGVRNPNPELEALEKR
jgi:MoCo/4Fe-4S cofactor protein with predicted Tat translocation signal